MTLQSPDAAERYQIYLQSGREAGEFPFVRADGEARLASYSACRMAQGQHLSILRDMTQAKRAEQKLRETEQERSYVLSSAQCQLWYADIKDSDHPDQLYWDAHFVDVEAAQHFFRWIYSRVKSYQDARRRARLSEDREVCDRWVRPPFGPGAVMNRNSAAMPRMEPFTGCMRTSAWKRSWKAGSGGQWVSAPTLPRVSRQNRHCSKVRRGSAP